MGEQTSSDGAAVKSTMQKCMTVDDTPCSNQLFLFVQIHFDIVLSCTEMVAHN